MKHMAFPIDPQAIPLPLRRMTRAEYDDLVKKGFFRPDERCELIFGVVVTMSPINPAHVESTNRVHRMLLKLLEGRARVHCQSPLAATDDSEPQPDVIVVPERDYWDDHPQMALLVVEVSRSSLRYDRGVKKLLYGISDVREYWVVDQVHGVIEVYRDPDGGEWRTLRTYRRGEMISLLEFPDVELPVSEILPPADMDGEQD